MALMLSGCGGREDGNLLPTPDPIPTPKPTPFTLTLALPEACKGIEASTPYTKAPSYATQTHSMARIWNEQSLNAVRRDFPRPTVHARNLFHVSASMYDAWSAYQPDTRGYLYDRKHAAATSETDVNVAVNYAAFQVLMYRASLSFDKVETQEGLMTQMRALGLNPCYIKTGDAQAAQIGNSAAATYIDFGKKDGSNEGTSFDSGVYKDTSNWESANGRLRVADPFDPASQPQANQFQLLEMAQATTQNGIATSSSQSYVTPHWGTVTPFALTKAPGTSLYHDPGRQAEWDSSEMAQHLVDVIRKTVTIRPDMGDNIDVSPASMGNHPLGTNDGKGHVKNPVTGAPYTPKTFARADWASAVARYWADGPNSETPPGHWNLIFNQVADEMGPVKYPKKSQRLAWELKTYFAMNGALHDAGVAGWEIKRQFQTARPISLIRHRAQLGQSSDPKLPSYNARGLPLIPGLIELVTAASVDNEHQEAGASVGMVVIRGYRPALPSGALILPDQYPWMRGDMWSPYQPANFVSPAFPGLVSGHSTFSRAAAEVLTLATGSAFFPGGIHTFVPDSSTLPLWSAQDIEMQAATYYDAADLAGISRIWGGIHIEPDDLNGRKIGSAIGKAAWTKAQTYFNATAP